MEAGQVEEGVGVRADNLKFIENTFLTAAWILHAEYCGIGWSSFFVLLSLFK